MNYSWLQYATFLSRQIYQVSFYDREFKKIFAPLFEFILHFQKNKRGEEKVDLNSFQLLDTERNTMWLLPETGPSAG